MKARHTTLPMWHTMEISLRYLTMINAFTASIKYKLSFFILDYLDVFDRQDYTILNSYLPFDLSVAAVSSNLQTYTPPP